MSTRVQKGAVVFKPIPKPRTRPSGPGVVTTNAATDNRSSAIPTEIRSPTSTVSAPVQLPSVIPARTVQEPPHTIAISRVAKGADPGEELDPTVITMAALCNDSSTGRLSSRAAEIQSNHAAWRASNRDKRARMKSLMESKKHGRNYDGEGATDNAAVAPTADRGAKVGGSENGNGFDYSQDLATSRFNVQVRIGPNGETVIDEESLFVDRNEEEDTENYTHVEESDTTKFVNSGTYGKRFRGSRWSAEETELFYSALSQFGENYELISYVLPGRDRKSCKNKFKSEDKKNPSRITYCLDHRIPYDIPTLARMTGKDFSGPTPEIHARTPLTLVESQCPSNRDPPASFLDTPAIDNNNEEITVNTDADDQNGI